MTVYTYAIESWTQDGSGRMSWVPDPDRTGMMKFTGTPAQLARRILNSYLADVASDAGLPVGLPGAGPAAMTRAVVWLGHEQVGTPAVVLSHDDAADRAKRYYLGGRPVWQGLPEPATWTAVTEAAQDIAVRMAGAPDPYPYLRDVQIVDPNDLEPGDAFLEVERPLATGGFWVHARSVSCGMVWLHVQVTMLPDEDIPQAERLLND